MTKLSLDDALAQLLAAARRVTGIDRVPLHQAAGRVLAEPVVSTIDVPPNDNSAMDGYAVCRAGVPLAGTRLKVAQRIAAGNIGHTLAPGTAARIFTGAPIPPGVDAVVMQELCEHAGDEVIINHVPILGEHIRRKSEDIASGAVVMSAGTRLTPQAVGMAAAVGLPILPVYRRLSVGLISTGSELAQPGEPLPPGGIYNSNRSMLLALLARLGCEVEDYGIVEDTLDATRKALRKAGALHDLVLTTGGVSVGEEDHVKAAVAAEGELTMWTLAIKPGKPVAFGRVGTADFMGLPGNPVSAFLIFVLLARPFILKCQGAQVAPLRGIQLPAAFEWARPGTRREFLRARQGDDGRLELFPNQGSGVLTSVLWADGFVDNPASQVIRPGDLVRFLPFTELLS